MDINAIQMRTVKGPPFFVSDSKKNHPINTPKATVAETKAPTNCRVLLLHAVAQDLSVNACDIRRAMESKPHGVVVSWPSAITGRVWKLVSFQQNHNMGSYPICPARMDLSPGKMCI